jgi:hypothetical protein
MIEYDWGGWTEGSPLITLRERNFPGLTETPGAYVIAARKLKIPRIFGVDTNGIVCVGESEGLRSRIRNFAACVAEGKDSHMAGWKYNLFNLKRCGPADSLIVRWFSGEDKEAARAMQWKILRAYILNHCEMPPLNGNLDRKELEKSAWRL